MNKIQVYWNSHKKLFSIRYKGKIIAWERNFALYKPKFVVSKVGRDRVLRERRKSVHAWVEGSIDEEDVKKYVCTKYNSIKYYPIYNPYKNASFIDKISKFPIYEADMVIFEVAENKPLLTAFKKYEQNQIICIAQLRGVCAA